MKLEKIIFGGFGSKRNKVRVFFKYSVPRWCYDTCRVIKEEFSPTPIPIKNYTVFNFDYNGLSGRKTGGNASYTAKINSWTTDPGILSCNCTDGKQRRIPGWALDGFVVKDMPPQNLKEADEITKRTMIHIGPPSTSN